MKLCYEAEGRAVFPKIKTAGMTVIHTADIADYSVMQMFGVFLVEMIKTARHTDYFISVVYTDYLHAEWLIDMLKILDDYKTSDTERDNKLALIRYDIKIDGEPDRCVYVYFVCGNRTANRVTGDAILIPFAEYLQPIVMRQIITSVDPAIIIITGSNNTDGVTRHPDLDVENGYVKKLRVGDKAPNKKQKK